MALFNFPLGVQLSIIGYVTLFLGIFFLIFSIRPKIETINLFPRTICRAHDSQSQKVYLTLREKADIELDIEITGSGTSNIFLTDIYPHDPAAFNEEDAGPKYFHFQEIGEFSESHTLREGQYQLVFGTNDSAYVGVFSLHVHYSVLPFKYLEVWGAVFSEIGIALLVTGLALS